MQKLGPEAIATVISICQTNAAEIGQSFSRVLDCPCEVSVGLGTTWDQRTQLDGLQGPGLALVIEFGEAALVAVLPESTGVLPGWYIDPGPTGTSRLETLAQELSLLVVPDSLDVGKTSSMRLESLADSIVAAAPEPAAARVPLVLHCGQQKRGVLSLVWPVTQPRKLADAAKASQANRTPAAKGSPTEATHGKLDGLPSYTRSLLRVEVPVSVTLAAKKQSVSQILELGAGSIIHFDKPCDEPLELEVNGRPVAQGEAVKVGEKFGLRVQSIVLPNERFKPVLPAGRRPRG